MTRIVRSALLQSAYTGDKQTMIDKHVNYVEQAASQGARRHGRGGGDAGLLSRDRVELDHRGRRSAAARRAAVAAGC